MKSGLYCGGIWTKLLSKPLQSSTKIRAECVWETKIERTRERYWGEWEAGQPRQHLAFRHLLKAKHTHYTEEQTPFSQTQHNEGRESNTLHEWCLGIMFSPGHYINHRRMKVKDVSHEGTCSQNLSQITKRQTGHISLQNPKTRTLNKEMKKEIRSNIIK